MALDTVTISPEEKGIETHGIERVSPQTRNHVRIFDNFTLWLSANLVISTVALGALAVSIFHLGFWDSVAAIIIFNIVGDLPIAFFATLGPKLGLRQMTISRFSFGWVGGIVMALFNVAACIGWSAVNIIVGGQIVTHLSNGAIPLWVGILVIAILTTFVSIYGYKYVHRYERYAWVPMAIIFAILTVVAGPKFTITASHATGIVWFASFMSFGGAIYGFATGWSAFASDYTVNQPEDTPASRVFWFTFLGTLIPSIILETLGVGWSAAYSGAGGGDLLAAMLKPLGGFGAFLLILLALSVIACNIPNDYSLGLSMQVLGKAFQRINRAVWTLVGAVIYILLALAVAQNFNETLDSFLLLIGYWLAPWTVILVLEHFVFRRGNYNVDDWNTRSKLPQGWAALVTLVLSLIGAGLGIDQVIILNGGTTFIPVVGPIAKLFGPYGMDVGFELSAIIAAVAYLILRRVELNASKQ